MNNKPKIKWTPAEYEGLLPVGTRVAVWSDDAFYMRSIPYTHVTTLREPISYWLEGTITDYIDPADQPMKTDGNDLWVGGKVETLVGYGFTAAAKDCIPLSIEKQPTGWPNHPQDRKVDLERLRTVRRIDEDEFSEMLIHWLKDHGYLKRDKRW